MGKKKEHRLSGGIVTVAVEQDKEFVIVHLLTQRRDGTEKWEELRIKKT